MKNFFIIIISLFFLSFQTYNKSYEYYDDFEPISVNLEEIDFGDVYENEIDSVELIFSAIENVEIENIFFETYGEKAFFISENSFYLEANETKNIWIKFSPKHNIYHNSEMLIIAHNSSDEYYSLSVDLRGQGKYSNSYYNNTENKSEQELKETLNNIISSGYQSHGYNQSRDEMYMLIDNKKVNGQGANQNTIECVYTGRIAVGYTSRSNLYSNHDINCEHTFPQSLFSENLPMRSDIHHLFPTDVSANETRSNYPFHTVNNPTWEEGGSKQGSNMFEPRDQQKGATARAMLYFVNRYENYNNFIYAQEPSLKNWNNDFPPTEIEKIRNNDIYDFQNNRNPYVDYPQLANRITSFASNSVENENYSLVFSVDTVFIEMCDRIYNISIVNNGNQTINLSYLDNDLQLLFVENGEEFYALGEKIIEVGEVINLKMYSFCPVKNETFIGNINFETNIPNQTNISIPVKFGDFPGSSPKYLSFNSPSIYPNPAKNEISIKFNDENQNKFSVNIYDIFGKKVKNLEDLYDEEITKISIEDLKNGIYFVKILSEDFIYASKILKN